MKRALLLIIVGALYALHQDYWFWRTARPLVFGFLPIGLFYHACYTVATALVIWMLVRHAWPSHLEEGGGDVASGRGGEGGWGDGAMGRGGDEPPRRRVFPSPVPPVPSRPVAPSPRRPFSSSGEGTQE